MKRILQLLLAYFGRADRRVVHPEPVPADPRSLAVLDAMLDRELDRHYTEARAVVDAGRDDPPTAVLDVVPAPIAPAPPAEHRSGS